MKKRILYYVMLVCISLNGFSQNTISDPFFDHVPYRGAFGTSDDWTTGWTNFDPQNTAYNTPDVTVSGEITSNTTWTSNHVYLLTGFVYVRDGVTLTIQPGTVIRGDKDSKGTLLIERGAKLMAEGTVDQPIVFTSNFPSGSRAYGDWGGIVLCGKAAINPAGGTAIIEGGPTSIYGGGSSPDDDDYSGSLKFIRIEFPGIPFVPDKEINGLTLGAIGKSTQLDYIQVSYSGDDSYEWFGGTVNAKHLIAYRGWDDDFDTDFGYRGMIQYAVSLRDKDIADPQSGSNGFESDNDGSGSTNTPVTNPIFSNVTIFGPKYTAATSINSNYKRGMHLRRNTRLNVYNSVFSGYPTGLFIDGTAAQGNATNGDLNLQHCILSGMGTCFASSFEHDFFMTASFGNDTVTTNDQLLYVDPFNLNNPDFLLQNGSFLKTGSIWGSVGINEINTAFNASIYPNPVSDNAIIRLKLGKATNVSILVYDITGHKVADIARDQVFAGENEIRFDASSLTHGMYFIQVTDGLNSSSFKFVVR